MPLRLAIPLAIRLTRAYRRRGFLLYSNLSSSTCWREISIEWGRYRHAAASIARYRWLYRLLAWLRLI
jgi:hypothetical protein